MAVTEPLEAIGRYYASRLAEHGTNARGVDWNGEDSQRLRFDQLLKIVDRDGPFTLNELGCGYGALVDYLGAAGRDCDYLGVDIAPEMIAAARTVHGLRPTTSFQVGDSFDRVADYTVASGIFNVRLDIDPATWEALILTTLEEMDRSATRGFAFNCLTSYSDPERMRDDLHYADPLRLFDHCKRHYARDVALLHDYGLYEFTLLVRKVL